MKTFARLLTILLCLALVAALGCKRDKNFKPSKLADDLYSGQSLQTVERKLNMMSGNFDVIEDRQPLPSDKRPPFRRFVISRKNTSLYGVNGELVLTFFNDRLMTTQFYPQDLEAATRAVDAADKISLESGEAHIDPATRVYVGKDESNRRYIGWIDKALQAEEDEWVKRYGSV